MSQYQSFFISASGNASQCEELNHFLRSHVVIRTVENIISGGTNCGIQILVEYREKNEANLQDKKNARIDWRASLATDEMREIFDKLKAFRLKLSKEKNLRAAFLICKDEHLAAIVSKSNITVEEIKALPNADNIMLSQYAELLHTEYQKILAESKSDKSSKSGVTQSQNPHESASASMSQNPQSVGQFVTGTTQNEESEIPF